MTQPDLAIIGPLKAWGGIERKLTILCREFVAKGVRVQLVLVRGGELPYPDEFPGEVEVVKLGNRGKLEGVFRLARHLRTHRPRAILAIKDHGATIALLSRSIMRLDLPVYVKITNTLSQTLRRRSKRWGVRILYPWLADRLIAVSHGVRDDLIAHFGIKPAQIEVIYNPTVTPDIAERCSLSVNHPWLADAGVPLIIGVGRLTPQKDFPTLLRAFTKVRAARPARLILLGDGPLRPELIQLARQLGVSSDVDFAGVVPDVIPWLARASLFVLSSRYEGLPNALIEALAAGCPVVSTDCPSGASEILMGGQLGSLVPIGDDEAMAHAMMTRLGLKPSPEIIAQSLDRFSSAGVAQQYLELMGIHV